ncbi:MAG: hypothetical protein IPM79_32835 [Polyangiaceae bacterium]|jgi:hypothetical protein|nr:hypothetical protein [Polyangiaceae bacterium]
MTARRSLPLFLALAACGDNLTLPPDRDPAADPDPPVLSCIPNLDGQIDRSELRPAIGTPVRYVVSPPDATRQVDLGGVEIEGDLTWDFATDYADDQALTVTPSSLEGKWYQASFADGAFVTSFDRDGDLESIGLVRNDSLVLLGLASSEENPPEGTTLLVYDPPIVVLQFPVTVGQQFISTGEITNGLVSGLPYAGRDTYEVSVDAEGEIDLLQLTFEQVHRVRTKVTVEPAVGQAVVRHQTSFFAECFAEVARATSRDGEADPNFTEAAELRRLGF